MRNLKKRIFISIFVCLMCVNIVSCNRINTKANTTGNKTNTSLATVTPQLTRTKTPYIAQYDNDNQRFANYWLANFDGSSTMVYEANIEKYLSKFNPTSMDVWVCWYNAEKKQGVYDFANYDIIIDLLASYGCKVFMRINTMDLPEWLYSQVDDKGRCIYTQWDCDEKDIVHGSATGGKRGGMLSYANLEARKFALDYTKAVVEHFTERYKDYPGGSPIHTYASTFSHCGEMEYDFSYSSSDYSPPAISAFRNWLENRYVDINLFNERWGTNYSGFDKAVAPKINNNTESVQEMDWLEYRAYEQGNMIKAQSEVIKTADPNAHYVMVFGSVFDEMIKRRGSLFADYWTDYVDWIGVADALSYNHRYSMSVVRGISKGGGFYNEGFKENNDIAFIRTEWTKITDESFDEGANQVNYAAFSLADVRIESNDYYRPGVDYVSKSPKVIRPTPKKAIYMSTWSITRDTAGITMGEGPALFDELRKDGYIDIIRDGTFENDVDYLVNNYTDIYFASNKYISDSARAALLEAQKRGVILHDANCTLDKFGNTRLSFDKIDTDKSAPKVMAIAGTGFLSGIASDEGSGISKIEVTFSDGKLIAQGTDTWTISTSGKTGVATVTAYDNNGNASKAVKVTIK